MKALRDPANIPPDLRIAVTLGPSDSLLPERQHAAIRTSRRCPVPRAWEVFVQKRKQELARDRPTLGAKDRFETIIQEWQAAGRGLGDFVEVRGRIESEQAILRRLWKKRKREGGAAAAAPGAAASLAVASVGAELHIEELD